MRPKNSLTLLVALIAAIGMLALPATALAQGGEEVIRDCAEDGDLDGDYSQKELDEAYENMPSDIDQYSNCREVIESARERSGGGTNNAAGSQPGATAGPSGGDGGGSGSGAPGGARNDLDELGSRADRSAADDAPRASVAGERAGNSGGTLTTTAADDGGMPTALIVALILAALGAIAGAAYLARDHLPAGIASRFPGARSNPPG